MIVAGACGVMASVLVTKHFRSVDSTSTAAPKTLEALASTPRAQHGGWLASEDQGAAGTGGGATARSQRLPGKGQAAAGGPSGERGSSADWASRDAGAGMAAGQGWGGGSGASAGYSESDPIHAETNAPLESGGIGRAGQPLRDAQGQTSTLGTGTEEVAKKTDNPAGAAPADPNAPVLSLPFNKTTDSATGDQAIINENVTCGGSGEGCVFDTNSRFAIPDAGNLSGDAGSISFCLQPQWAGNDLSNADLVDLHGNTWENRFKVFKNDNGLRFLFWPSSGIETGVAARIDNWAAGTWHPVTATYGPNPDTGVNMVSLYVDGGLIGQAPYDSELNLPQAPLYIGEDVPSGSPAARSSLMNFQVYNRVLNPDEAVNFADGCPQ
jgi:hypothetical protein